MGLAAADGLAVAKAELDSEIHSDPDKQHGKGHGNQVELAHGEGGVSPRPHKPHDQGDKSRRGQAQRTEADNHQHAHEYKS